MGLDMVDYVLNSSHVWWPGDLLDTSELSKGDDDSCFAELTNTQSKDGIELIAGWGYFQSCLTFLADLFRSLHWWIASASMALLLVIWWEAAWKTIQIIKLHVSVEK